MCGFCCIAFIEYMLAGKALLDYANWCYSNEYKKNEKTICTYLKEKHGRRSNCWLYILKIDKTRDYLLDEIKHNNLLSEKYKRTCNCQIMLKICLF